MCVFLASGVSSVASHEDRRGGEESIGVTAGGRGLGQQWGGSSTVGGSSTSKNRPSNHKYKTSKNFELKQT